MQSRKDPQHLVTAINRAGLASIAENQPPSLPVARVDTAAAIRAFTDGDPHTPLHRLGAGVMK